MPTGHGRTWITALGLLAALALAAPPAPAQTARVRVVADGTTIWSRPELPAVSLAIVDAGTELDALGRLDGWYQVSLPPGPTGSAEVGYIIVRAVELISGEVPPIEPTRRPRRPAGPRPAPAPPGTRPAPGPAGAPRSFVTVAGSFVPTSFSLDQSVSAFQEYGETGRFDVAYGEARGFDFEVTGGAMLGRTLFLAGGISRFSDPHGAAVDASVPHPFFFNRSRTIAGTSADLEHEELGVHVQAGVLVPLGRSLEVSVFGGPSYIRLKKALVTGVTFDETFPFDEATFRGTVAEEQTEWAPGFNVGADVSYLFTSRLGIGTRVRFDRALVDLPLTGGTTTEVEAGGVRVGVSVRAKF